MAYNLLDLTTNVQDDLGDTSFSTTRIRRYLNHGQRIIFGTHDFKFCEESKSDSLTTADTTLTLPTDHENTWKLVLFDPTDATKFYVFNEDSYLNPRDFFDKYPKASAQDNNLPSAWTEYGGLLYFNLPIDKDYNYTLWYYRIATPMSADSDVPDVPETFRELLELWADYRGEKYRGNHDIAATYKQEFEDELENMGIKFAGNTGMVTIARQTRRHV